MSQQYDPEETAHEDDGFQPPSLDDDQAIRPRDEDSVVEALTQDNTAMFVIATITLCALCNMIVPSGFDHGFLRLAWMEYVGLFMAGCLCAEFGMLAMWAGLGKQLFKNRILWTFCCAVLASCTYIFGMRVLDDRLPFSVALLFVSIGI